MRSHTAEGAAIVSEAIFNTLLASFLEGMNSHRDGVCESYYAFAGCQVRLRVFGRKLADQICTAFTHLKTEEKTGPTLPQLTIDLWDGAQTDLSSRLASIDEHIRAIWPVADGTLTSSPDSRFVGHQLPQFKTWLDRKARRLIGWTPSGKELLLHERGKPLLSLLSMWYKDQEIQVVHAGMVSRDGRGVLFPGSARAGKSTSALACLCAGFDFLGDDYIGLQVAGEDSFVGHSLYNSTFLEIDHLARFPLLMPHAIDRTLREKEKPLILLSQVFPMRLKRSAPIRVVVLPRVVDAAESRIRPASKGEVLLGLIPSSIVTIVPRPGAQGFERLARLVEHVPCYWLELGRDIAKIPHLVEDLLAEAARS